MSTFSRGLLLRPQCLRAATKSIFHPIPKARLSRPFSTTSSLFFPAKDTRNKGKVADFKRAPQKPPLKGVPKPSYSPKTTPDPIAYTSSYSNITTTLAAKPSPTLLYIAPPHSSFIFSAYAIGLSTLAYTAYNLEQTVFHPPPDLSPWVTPSFAIICAVTSFFGVWFLRAPRRLIKSISAVPTTISGTATAPARRELKLHIELRKLLPGTGKWYSLVVADPGNCGLNAALTPPKDRIDAYHKRLAEVDRAWVAKAKTKSILTLPFRQMKLAIHKLIISMMRVWRRDGFLEFYVGKKEYKLDISGGWALEEGKVLDRLVKVRTTV